VPEQGYGTVTTDFFASLLQTVAERGRALIGLGRGPVSGPSEIIRRIDELLSGRGEASGVALAQRILTGYMTLTHNDRIAVLTELNDRFGPDMDRLKQALAEFSETQDADAAARLHAAAEPRRQELIRRLNLAPGGIRLLVRMRGDLQRELAERPQLAALDRDFVHLFSAWFNRGFLVLRRIDWSTPANILEKIIRYEAVHAIADWNELRRRLEPTDRRLYAFFHPALVDEPLIFVEVALTNDMPNAIAPLLSAQRVAIPADDASTAVFYSISNTQQGLAGVSFGNFLIKQVVEELKRELPRLETFVTLSPVPAFARWLAGVRADEQTPLLTGEDRRALAFLDNAQWFQKASAAEAVSLVLSPLAAHYFLRVKRSDGRPIDPVARFHLGNGARLERLNLLGDVSPTAMQQSHGLMVNYQYALADIETNHESFANRGEVVATSTIRKLARGLPTTRSPLVALPVRRS
jgi:malonyl-CoA decarboxylase